jgi:indolepyruvate ferredoxin oxidoreductase, beta subunit
MMKLDIVFSGVGVQGIVVASDIFCQAALLDGFVAKKSEIHGIAKRGGSIDAHVRVGDEVFCPMIERGTADLILGFELLETARALPMLKPNGVVVVNTKLMPTVSTFDGKSNFPKKNALIKVLEQKTPNIHAVDATALASKAGNASSVSSVLLGALAVTVNYQVSEKSIRIALSERFNGKSLEVNLNALRLGAESVKV